MTGQGVSEVAWVCGKDDPRLNSEEEVRTIQIRGGKEKAPQL